MDIVTNVLFKQGKEEDKLQSGKEHTLPSHTIYLYLEFNIA